MGFSSPLELIQNFMDAINRGDLDSVLDCYEQDAILISQPGAISKGREQIRAALAEFIAMKPKITSDSHKLVDVGNMVLFCSKWNLVGTTPDGKRMEIGGISSDVFRQQKNGDWLVAIDNPWGTAIVD